MELLSMYIGREVIFQFLRKQWARKRTSRCPRRTNPLSRKREFSQPSCVPINCESSSRPCLSSCCVKRANFEYSGCCGSKNASFGEALADWNYSYSHRNPGTEFALQACMIVPTRGGERCRTPGIPRRDLPREPVNLDHVDPAIRRRYALCTPFIDTQQRCKRSESSSMYV